MAESAHGTAIPGSAQIEDAGGAIWTFRTADRSVLRNGAGSGIVDVQMIFYLSGVVWAYKGTHWRKYVSGRWHPGEVTYQMMPAFPADPNTHGITTSAVGLRSGIVVGPQALASFSGVQLTTASDVAAVMAANPPGTTYVFAVGTYNNLVVVPKRGDRFVGLHNGTTGVVFNGGGVTGAAFYSTAAYVTIENIRIINYFPSQQHGQIEVTGDHLRVLNCNSDNAARGAGIYCGNYCFAACSTFNGNEQQGYSCHGDVLYFYVPLPGITFYNVDFDGNNPLNVQKPGSEQGGGKALETQHLFFLHCRSRSNGGSNFWTDSNNIWTKYWYNECGPGGWNGFEHEISYDCQIVGNFIHGVDAGASGAAGFFSNSGIFGGNSGKANPPNYRFGIEIAYNKSVQTNYGRTLAFRYQNRIAGDRYNVGLPRWVWGYNIHHNDFDWSGATLVSGGHFGFVQDQTDTRIFYLHETTIDNNTYRVGNLHNAFAWKGSTALSFNQWKSLSGFDANSTLIGNPIPIEWNDAWRNVNVTLSGSNKIATAAGSPGVNYAGGATESAAIYPGNKKIFVIEATNGGSNLVAAGLVSTTTTFNDNEWLGSNASSVGYYDNGEVWKSATVISTKAAYGDNAKIVLCVHGDNEFFVGVNAVPSVTPGTGIPIAGMGTVYAAYNLMQGGVATFDPTAAGFTPPAGYSILT